MELKLFRLLVRRAFELPPHVAARKAFGLAGRLAGNAKLRARDRLLPSYGAGIGALSPIAIQIDLGLVDPASREALAEAAQRYLAHQFDILGSGWVDVGYGAKALGIEGVLYDPDADALKVARSGDPIALIGPANRRTARRIFDLIETPDYQPIDWQRDMRSGYRWSCATPWASLRIGQDRGADIKMPWELSRMQHLPQLAIAAGLAKAGRGDGLFGDSATYVGEIRSQLLDFIASNPPRFGACWGCPMDVAIRVANWVLTLGLLEGFGLHLDGPALGALAASIHDHAKHIAQNLEWSEDGRSNHYLSDLVGLFYASAILPGTPETQTWLNFSAREIVSETGLQFHGDGGNYEGSTGYHRLSAELSVFGLSLIAGLVKRSPGLFDRLDATVVSGLRPPAPPPDVPMAERLAALAPRLSAMRAFTRAMTGPDGRFIQVGDMDSGRLFKILPTWIGDREIAPDGEWREDPLRAGETIEAFDWLLGEAATPAKSVVGAVVAALAAGNRVSAVGAAKGVPAMSEIQSPDDLDELEQRLLALPDEARRVWRFARDTTEPNGTGEAGEAKRIARFPDFGLFVIRAPGLYMAFRCAGHQRPDAPYGHTHDDNLGLDLILGSDPVVADPGTYVYTSLPEWRNAYRRAGAHFVPRPMGRDAVLSSEFLFDLTHLARARLLHISSFGLAGVLDWTDGCRVYRVVRIEANEIRILDAVEGGSLAPGPAQWERRCEGYGRRTARPVVDV